MKPALFCLLLFFGFSYSTFCNSLKDSLVFRSELELLKNTIEQKHINPFDQCNPTTWENAWKNLFENIALLHRDEIVAACISIVSELQDEHTMVFPMDKFTLPFRLKWTNEGAIIFVTDSSHQNLLNTTLLEINGVDIFHAKHLIGSQLKQDNLWYVEDMSNYFFVSPTLLKAKKILNPNASNFIKVKDALGKIREEQIQLLPTNVRHQWIYAEWTKSLPSFQKTGNYWFHFDEQNKALYLNYEKCKEDENYPFKNFLKDVWSSVKLNHPKKIIIDLRSNPGGNSAILQPLIKKIASSPYNEKGKLFVLIGTKVISSSLINAVQFKQKTKAIFIGQPTSGNLIHFGEIKSFELPLLQCRVIYSTNKFDLMNGTKGSLHPDIEITYTIADYRSGKDPAYEIAISE